MRKGLKTALSGALCGAVLATAMPADALAGPMGVAPPSTVALSGPVDKVWYRRGWGGGHYGHRGYYRQGYYRRGNPGAAIAAGIGLGLLGAGLAASSSGYYGGYYPYYGGGWGGGGWGGGGWGGGGWGGYDAGWGGGGWGGYDAGWGGGWGW